MQFFPEVLDFIRPRQVGDYWFIGQSPKPQQRIFGGQVLAQCLLAAYETVDETLTAHSMHAYFLRAGDSESRIEFEVDPIRNGRSFCTRRVVARQHGDAIFNTAISFHKAEEGVEHAMAMPVAPSPEGLEQVINPEAQIGVKENRRPNLMDLYGVERWRVPADEAAPKAPRQQSWIRLNGDIGDDQRLNQAALAMISDFALLSTAFRPHDVDRPDRHFMAASLDHSIWFHNPVRMNDFVLYDCDSPWSANARGFSRGTLWSRAGGTLLASTCQESLMRPMQRD